MQSPAEMQEYLQEFMDGMQRKLVEPEGKRMLKVNHQQNIDVDCFLYVTKEAFRVFDSSGEGMVTGKYLKLSILNTGDSSKREVYTRTYI